MRFRTGSKNLLVFGRATRNNIVTHHFQSPFILIYFLILDIFIVNSGVLVLKSYEKLRNLALRSAF